jgi:hypothetical protein
VKQVLTACDQQCEAWFEPPGVPRTLWLLATPGLDLKPVLQRLKALRWHQQDGEQLDLFNRSGAISFVRKRRRQISVPTQGKALAGIAQGLVRQLQAMQ